MSMETSAQARPKPVPSWEQFTADFTTEYDSNKYVCFYLFILFMFFSFIRVRINVFTYYNSTYNICINMYVITFVYDLIFVYNMWIWTTKSDIRINLN